MSTEPPVSPERSDGLIDAWFGDLDRLVVKYQQNPLRAARAYAYVAVAMRDGWFLCEAEGCTPESAMAAAHLAAGHVVDLLYPQESAMMWEAVGYARSREERRLGVDATKPSGAKASQAEIASRIADNIAAAARRRMLNDSNDLRAPPTLPSREPGRWVGTAPLFAALPAEASAGQWLTWSGIDVGAARAPKPPAVSSDEYRAEVLAVLQTRQQLLDRQRQIADKWHLDQGSVTPAGVWNRLARDEFHGSNLSLRQRLDALAQLHVAMFDAFVACWDTKLAYSTERPITAIHRMYDRTFAPHLATPQFPSYVSGHAAVSGAADLVLGRFLPERAAKFRAMANEAADSRLYGGIHFPIDNSEGLKLGRRVGEHVLKMAPASRQ